METIMTLTESARYSGVFDDMLEKNSGGKEVLSLSYESDYSGFVDVDVLLNDGRVCSYKYYYGSCSGCDEWEYRCLTDIQVADVMQAEATWFNNIEDYRKFDALRKK